MRAFQLGMILGRFQHMHRGHVQMIEKALGTCEKVLLLIGSSQESFTVRNPFTLKTRMDIICNTFKKEVEEKRLFIAHLPDTTNENDHNFEWGDYVFEKIEMWRNHFDIKESLDLLITGEEEDRKKWFRPEAVEHVSQLVLSRSDIPISATKMREFILQDNHLEWLDFMPKDRVRIKDLMALYKELHEELLRIPQYKELVK